MTITRSTILSSVLTALVLFAVDAHAQPFDHLECYKIKDPLKAKYTANLTPEQTQFLAQTGCQIKAPAKTFCIDVDKSNVQPTPPLNVGGGNTRDYLCYVLKCPKNEMQVPVRDQFGQRTITVKVPNRLCAPAEKIGFPVPPTPTPCLPPQPTVTTTPGVPTCTDGIQNGGETGVDCGGAPSMCPLCGSGQGCFGNQNCQSNFCAAGQCQPSCMAPFLNCNGNPIDGCETNVNTDLNNCGMCGFMCPDRPNSSPTCSAGNCAFSCDPGFANCNGAFGDGCEVNTQTSPTNCNMCGVICPMMFPNCVNGACQM